MHTPLITAFAPLLALAFTATSPAATPSLEDTFTNGTADGVALHERRLVPGPGTWEASRNLTVVREGGRGFATVGAPGSFVARVPVPADGKTLVLAGELRAVAGTERGGWVAIGFGEPSLNPVKTLWTGGVFVLLNPRGEFECHYSPSGESARLQRIRSGRIANHDASKPTPFVLRLDREHLTLDVEINGTAVIRRYELANLTDSVSSAFAGFSGFEQKPGTDLVSSFSVSVAR